MLDEEDNEAGMFWFIFISSIYLMILVLISVFRQVAPAGRRVALVIGNTAYKSPYLPRLEKSAKDAAAVADALTRLGFDVVRGHDLSNAEMHRALGDFIAKTGDAAWALVYYSGHGMEWEGKNWLIPIGANLAYTADLQGQAVSVERVLDLIPRASKLRIVILDACRNCPLKTHMMMNKGLTRVTRGLAAMKPAFGGDIVFFAARHGTEAFHGDKRRKNSFFTGALLEHMEIEGLELGRFFRKVTSSVLEAIEATGATEKQEPFVYGHIPDEDFYFKPPRRSR